jgi:hypothetical protein
VSATSVAGGLDRLLPADYPGLSFRYRPQLYRHFSTHVPIVPIATDIRVPRSLAAPDLPEGFSGSERFSTLER